jgi:filamentous hemagglutinin family protein
MNHHTSINRIYRLVWSAVRELWIPAAENARNQGKRVSRSAATLVATALMLGSAYAQAGVPAAGPTAGPSGGVITAGSASITQSANLTTITQASPRLSLTWNSFNIPAKDTVDFLQPSASALAVNRILDVNGTQILGHLNANGQVYLINPNGVVFGPGAEVNVGGLVASTLALDAASAPADAQSFSGDGAGSVINRGTIHAAPGGYVALLGRHVGNSGVISAQLGTVAMGAGSAATLKFKDTHLVSMQIDQSVLNSIAANGGLIRADGGQVLMSAGAEKSLLASVVNNTGVIEARTLDHQEGTIILRGGMVAGTVNLSGTLDASAPGVGNGGGIETSAAHVHVADGAMVTTQALSGTTGTWLIDPQDFTVAASGGDISGATLSAQLATTNAQIQSSAGATAGSGDINVDDTVHWSSHTLTLTAADNINVNAVMNATGSAALNLEPATANGADAAVAGGTVNMGMDNLGNFTGQVNFSAAGTLTMGGQVYTVINSLGTTSTDMTVGTLQGMQANLGGHYALGTNINASGTSTWNSGAGFAPIGAGAPFTGTFDGLGHTISGLTLNNSNYTSIGLFGTVEGISSAPVFLRNVALTNLAVTCYDPCGGLLGYGEYYTTIQNVSVSGSISGVDLEDVGMIAGYLESYNGAPPYDSKIVNVYSSGTMFANESEQVGGIVGEIYYASLSGMHSSVTMTFQPGDYDGGVEIGGLVGEVDGGSIAASAFTGTINLISSVASTSNTADYSKVGGLVGDFDSNDPLSTSHSSASILGTCPVNTCGNGDGDIGGLVGLNNGPITSSYATGVITLAKDSNRAVAGLVGDSGDYPISNSYSTVTITAPGSYNQSFAGFIGEFDGQPITNSYSTGSVTVGPYGQSIGGFAGYGNCCQNMSVVYSTGAVTAGANSTQVGGFAGYLDNTNLSNAYSTGPVISGAGSSNVAAFVGEAGGALVLTNTYASGATVGGSGSTYVGGLVGMDDGGNTVTASYWDTTSTGQSASALGHGMTTAQMQQQVNFTSSTAANGGVNPNWDFAGTWVMYNGNTYPLLQAFMTPLTVSGTVAQTYDGAAFAPTISNLTYSIAPDFTHLFGTVTITGTAVGATHVGSYSFTPGGLYSDQQGYIIAPYVGGTLTIDPAPLTVAGTTVGTRIYNGTTGASLSGGALVGVFGSDNVTLAQAGTFTSKHAGTGIGVTVTDSLGGASDGDYVLVEPVGLTGSITPASLTVIGTVVGNKVYNGNSSAPLLDGSLSGVVPGDSVSLIQAGNFASASVGSGIAVTAADSLGGPSALDYSIIQPSGLHGTISPATTGNTPGTPGGSGTSGESGSPLLAAYYASAQVDANFVAPQWGATPQVVDASPSIDVVETASEPTSTDAGDDQTSSSSSTAGGVVINVAMKIGATGTLKIVSGGLRLPVTHVQ